MIAVENPARVLEVDLVLGVDTPRQHRQPVEVIAGDAVFRRAGFQQRQLVHFLVDALFRRFGQRELGDALVEGVELGGLVVLGEAQFFLNRLELLAQEEFALLLAHLLVDLFADVRLQARDVELLLQQHQHLLHALFQREGFQHVLQGLFRRGGEAGGKVGQLRRLVGAEAVEEELEFLGIQRIKRQQVLDRVDDGDGVRADFLGIRPARLVRVFDPDLVGRGFRQPFDNAETPRALGDELHLAVGSHRMMDAHHRADALEVAALHIVGVVGLDHHQPHHVMRRFADGLHGRQPRRFVHQQGQGLRREKGLFSQRQQVQLVRQRWRGRQLAIVGHDFAFECGFFRHDADV